jgi:hypothetical protein
MSGETDLTQLLRTMTPVRQAGTYVFCTVASLDGIDLAEVLNFFREEEAITVILPKSEADRQQLTYSYEAAWLTLTVHSSLAAVGLTAAFAQALAEVHISCNVVAAYYHDHIFVAVQDADRALDVLQQLAANS